MTRLGELAEDQGDPFFRLRGMKAEKTAEQGFEVDAGLDDDQEESADHKKEHVLECPLEGPQGWPVPAAVAPADGR